jgi:DNA-binding NarL/FixJ family response regulator
VTIRVIIADDQPLMRSALRMCLSSEPDIEVIAEASDGLEAVLRSERLEPDVVIMDIRMPTLDGVAATARLTAMHSDRPVRVLMITTFDLDEYVVEALRAGASGFLLKDATPEQLVYAVRVVAAGEALLAPKITKRLLDLYAKRLTPVRRSTGVLGQITKREEAVLLLVAEGRSNAEIASLLHLAESSVKSHVGHLLAKLGLTDRVQLVIFAYDNGLVWHGRQPTVASVVDRRSDGQRWARGLRPTNT